MLHDVIEQQYIIHRGHFYFHDIFLCSCTKVPSMYKSVRRVTQPFMKVALGQLRPQCGNISYNIDHHIKFIRLACTYKCDVIFFPELSITSYEPNLAKYLMCSIHDSRFIQFQNICDEVGIVICVGVPTIFDEHVDDVNSKPMISMAIFQPYQTVIKYSKQILHNDEFPFFNNGSDQVMLSLKDHIFGLSICYESRLMKHFDKCIELGSTIYIASVAKSQKGLSIAEDHYKSISKTNPVLMVNAVGDMDNFLSVGGSGVWIQGRTHFQAGCEEGCIVHDIQTLETTFYSLTK
jgi:predicted amidohydrolase